MYIFFNHSFRVIENWGTWALPLELPERNYISTLQLLVNTIDKLRYVRLLYVKYDQFSTGNQMSDRKPEFESETLPRLTGTLDGKYNYVPLGSRKPCLYVRSWWPNLDWRMHNSNSLAFIADFLVSFVCSSISKGN